MSKRAQLEALATKLEASTEVEYHALAVTVRDLMKHLNPDAFAPIPPDAMTITRALTDRLPNGENDNG